MVSGNDQVGFPGQVLREPLVVRLEDRFDNPIPREPITAQLIEGLGTFVDPPQPRRQRRGRTGILAQASGGATRTELTDATTGQVQFFLRVDSLTGIADVRTSAPALPQAGEQQFRVDIARIEVGTFPQALAVADVNGDGVGDVLTANADSDDISVLLGQGDGTFVAQQRLRVGNGPLAIAVADVNGDGWGDVLTANADSDDISVLLGRGDGTFVAQQRFRVGNFPRAITVADVNGDGVGDVLTANADSNDISVLRGRGDGSFDVFGGSF
jgi:hypothetical protein